MRSSGGLKLSLQAAGRDDRRLRFASLSISKAGSQDEVMLVTDARGRLRYRLPPGDYRLRLGDGSETRFAVSDRWTAVRIVLS